MSNIPDFDTELKCLIRKHVELLGIDIDIDKISNKINDYINKQKKQKSQITKRTKKKYQTEEERIAAYKAQQNNYAKKKWKCDVCVVEIYLGNKTTHLRSIKHMKNAADNGNCPTYCDSDESNGKSNSCSEDRDCPTCSDSE